MDPVLRRGPCFVLTWSELHWIFNLWFEQQCLFLLWTHTSLPHSSITQKLHEIRMGNFPCVVFFKSSRHCVMLSLDSALLAILFLCFLCLSYSCLLNLLHIILCLSIPVFLIKSLTSLKSRSIHPLVLPSKVNCRPPIGSLCAIFLNNCLLLLGCIFNWLDQWWLQISNCRFSKVRFAPSS